MKCVGSVIPFGTSVEVALNNTCFERQPVVYGQIVRSYIPC